MRLMNWVESRPTIQRWMRGRLPRCQEVILSQRQIFVFLTREGLLFGFLLFYLILTIALLIILDQLPRKSKKKSRGGWPMRCRLSEGSIYEVKWPLPS